MRKLERELHRAFPLAVIKKTRSGHYKLRLPNGALVFTSSTPSDRRGLSNLRHEVRKRLDQDKQR